MVYLRRIATTVRIAQKVMKLDPTRDACGDNDLNLFTNRYTLSPLQALSLRWSAAGSAARWATPLVRQAAGGGQLRCLRTCGAVYSPPVMATSCDIAKRWNSTGGDYRAVLRFNRDHQSCQPGADSAKPPGRKPGKPTLLNQN